MSTFPNNDIISLVGDAPRFDLAESVGPNLVLSEIYAGASGGLQDLPLAYGTAAGDAALREAVAQTHGVSADDVVITVGGMHALFLIAFTLCERGDEAVAASPLFPLALNALTAVGAVTRTFPLAFESGYQPDLKLLVNLLSPRTKLVSLASPQNPSGVAIPTATLREIIGIMTERAPQAWLLWDETYREAAHGDDPVPPSGVTLGPRVISVASLSKCYGAAGLRIGWAILRDKALRDQLVTAKFNTVVSCSPLDEALALSVFRQRERILGERRSRLRENVAITAEWVQANEAYVEWVKPAAGTVCCVRLKCSAFDDAAVERFYVAMARQDARVGNGDWFGEEKRVFRLGFGLPSAAELRAAFERLSVVLRQTASMAA